MSTNAEWLIYSQQIFIEDLHCARIVLGARNIAEDKTKLPALREFIFYWRVIGNQENR